MEWVYFDGFRTSIFNFLGSRNLMSKRLTLNLKKITCFFLISFSIASAIYSPYNVTVSIFSHEIKVNSYRITSWNIGFALVYIAVNNSIAYIYIVLSKIC
jgi:hypothetical protein